MVSNILIVLCGNRSAKQVLTPAPCILNFKFVSLMSISWHAAKREYFLVRMAPAIIKALKKWSAGELGSINGQIEYIILGSLRKKVRIPKHQPIDEDYA